MTTVKSIPCTFRKAEPSPTDLDKIRQDAGNPELTADDVIVFGKSMIGRSDIPGNGFRFTPQSLKDGASSFVGKAINLDHQYKKASQQVARIFDAWTEDAGSVTYLYVNSYAVKTADLADVHTRMFNRQHREMSMGAGISKAHCSKCNADVMPFDCVCPKHGDQADYVAVVDAFTGDHVSFVGDPAIEGAQLLNSKNPPFMLSIPGGATQQQLDALQEAFAKMPRGESMLVEDGRVFRDWVKSEFSKWYRLNNRDAQQADIDSLTDRLTAREMMTFARIEQGRFAEVIPSGAQQLTAPESTDEAPAMRSAEEIKQSFRKGI